MTQSGTVIKTEGEYAEVEVMRTSACVGCSKQEGCIACKKRITCRAYNPLHAEEGDRVVLESESSKVLLYAFLVFVLPIVAALIGYFTVSLLGGAYLAQIITSACIFILVYVIIYFTFDRNKQSKNTVRIVKIENINQKAE